MNTEIRITCEDCIGGMSQLPSASVNLVVTSPPYNLGTQYTRYNDTQTRKDYLAWTRKWIEQVRRVLSDDGSFFLNIGASPVNPFLPHEMAMEVRSAFVLQNTFHWIKSITVDTKDGRVSSGHFKPLNSRRFVTDCHEYVFHLTKTGRVSLDRLAVGVPYVDKSNIRRWGHTKGKDTRCRGNAWFIPYETIKNRQAQRPHPATFPVQLPIMCIRLHGLRTGLTVLDPFLGIGNSALAALETGVSRFIGFDIDPDYIAQARKALAQRGHGSHPE
jgi:site-specific DNA-methyltransferase (adenine-specific)